MLRSTKTGFAFAVALLTASRAFAATPDGGWLRSPVLPDGGRAARFTDFTPVPPTPKEPDSSCIGTSRDGGCVFSFAESDADDEDPSRYFFPDGGRRPSPRRLSFDEESRGFTLAFNEREPAETREA